MAEAMPPLRIVAQPKASYRARYMCEGRPCRNRAQRFVRSDDNPDKYVYPTIEVKIFIFFSFLFQLINFIFFNQIPSEWIGKLQQPIYIRLTHVTVPNELVNVRCVHPYSIDTEDINVIKDQATNSLFFPVSNEELTSGRKRSDMILISTL
jgi:hypothetical protein